MKKVLVFLLVSLGVVSLCLGQLNDYKYLIVPKKFDAFKKENQFQTSTLVKYMLTNEGFNVVYDDDFPVDLAANRCLGLMVDIIDDSSLFTTKTKLLLKDCNGATIFETQEGSTKTKEYKQAYKEAISEAIGSLRGLNYKYEPKQNQGTASASETITLNFKNDVKSLEPKRDTTSTIKQSQEITPQADTTAVLPPEEVESGSKDMLYAQPIEGGYQLVDTSPKVVYVLKSTSAPDVFLVNKDGKNGVVFKNEGKWFIEMDEKGSRAKELNIKF